MNREKLIEGLKAIIERQKTPSDIEADHCRADELLLEFINDPEVSDLFNEINKWYA